MARAMRWGDNDKYWGPFTYAKSERDYNPFAVVLSSGDDDEYPGCRLRVSGFGRTVIASLPAIINPYKEKVVAHSWSDADVKRMGQDWYWNKHEREYGFSVSDGFLQVFLGRSTNDIRTEQKWCKFLPWTQWRHVRRSLYDLNGQHFWTEPNRKSRLGETNNYLATKAVEESCPRQTFYFTDFDGKKLFVKTRIEEREWRFGEGWFKWLSLFRKPKIQRSLDLEFSGETGKRKGSWKGGTLGHSIGMLPGELHEAAFRRYCAENNMTFFG